MGRCWRRLTDPSGVRNTDVGNAFREFKIPWDRLHEQAMNCR
jgi:hypothetical protein